MTLLTFVPSGLAVADVADNRMRDSQTSTSRNKPVCFNWRLRSLGGAENLFRKLDSQMLSSVVQYPERVVVQHRKTRGDTCKRL
jgi:hypothetical protein